eukprot:CAMPEP_0196601258 /NCGR_PEP_ID=MMETSP1081-20130531/95815_1 /TAXON_ID=36882 /ORGANISM="Pyramimonas amylifera, Strain CCMP720" /LENGTH=235 /DNA_ID=CAMNT_0041927129 /DNA_START=780 /DNA_END=1487 /DNA_ORIENTATION=+
MVGEMPAMQVVNMLNELYSLYDQLAEVHSVYKVETIGDAFMCAGGVPDQMDPEESANHVISMALGMIQKTEELITVDGLKLQIRIGVHSGPVVAAVIGVKMPHYCLFGDTVNVASRMESNSEPMRTHISLPTFELLKNSSEGLMLEERGLVEIKGKGEMFTYWVTQATESDSTKDLPLPGAHLPPTRDHEVGDVAWKPLTVESFIPGNIEDYPMSVVQTRIRSHEINKKRNLFFD